MHMTEIDKLGSLIEAAHDVVVIQADNPDADSLASALALEQILHELGKEPILYCGIDMPEYLRYLPGWDRVDKELPARFDASIIVDTSTITLLERLNDSGKQGIIASKPVIVLDHHATANGDIPFATIMINDHNKVSTGELIYSIASQLKWPLNDLARGHIKTSILSDSMGLTTENTTAQTSRVMAELVDSGVSRPALEEQRRAYNKMHPDIFAYKAQLITRTEFFHDGMAALVTVPQQEINDYSPLYNPAPLIQTDHLQTKGVLISIVFKKYDSGRVTAAIRCAQGAPIAAKLAEQFGGGGHDYAAGFKVEDRPFEEIRQACIDATGKLIDNLEVTST